MAALNWERLDLVRRIKDERTYKFGEKEKKILMQTNKKYDYTAFSRLLDLLD